MHSLLVMLRKHGQHDNIIPSKPVRGHCVNGQYLRLLINKQLIVIITWLVTLQSYDFLSSLVIGCISVGVVTASPMVGPGGFQRFPLKLPLVGAGACTHLLKSAGGLES